MIFAILIVSLYISNKIIQLNNPDDINILNRGIIILGLEFIAIGIGFIIYGALTIKVLKANFSKFYIENYCYLIGATLCLSVPLILRGLLNLLNGVWPAFDDFTTENISLYNVLIYLIGTVIPIAF